MHKNSHYMPLELGSKKGKENKMSFYTAEIAIVNGEETASLFKWETLDDARRRLYTHGLLHWN